MDKIFKQYGKEKLEEAAKNSNSFVEATQFLGLNPNDENDRKSVMRSIKNNNISYNHFKTINRITEFNKEEISILIEKCDNYGDILKELNLPISYKEKLANYLYRNKMSFSSKKNLLNSEVWNKEILTELVKESKTQKEVLEKMKIRSAGGNYHTLRKYINLFDIDTSHFIKNFENMVNVSINNKIPLDQILVENSDYSRTSLKNRLYNEGLKIKICELCGQGEEWNGKHMSLILDHKNGVHNDNRLENLRIVCPNCNATLDTHAGKNNKKKVKVEKNKKTKIEKIKQEKSKSRSKLEFSISRRKVERPSFDVLKTEINTLGYSAVGRKYGVSDNAIKKWMKTYEKYGK